MARPFVVDGPPQIAQSWLVLIGSLEKAEVLTDSLRRGISRELLESLIRVHCRCIWKGRIDHGEGGGAFGREASARCGDAWLLGLRPTTIQRSNFFQESIHFCNMRCKQSVEYAFPNKPQGQTKQLPEHEQIRIRCETGDAWGILGQWRFPGANIGSAPRNR
jgi:hypothetical protein